MNHFLSRLREPSTWAGIAALGGLLGVPTNTISLVGQVVIAAGALAAVVLPETKPATPPAP